MNGMLLIHKPAGMTSFDVIAKLRRKYRISKIGHTGTLDPDATGLLLVLFGNSTKLVPFLDYKDKEYIAEYAIGYTSDTLDMAGNVEKCDVEMIPDVPAIKEALDKLTGNLVQVPPKYSAIRVKGKHLYEYARKGEEIEIPKRNVTVFAHEYLSSNDDKVRVRIVCSSGTYIRSLAYDFGELIRIPSIMASLQRTRIGAFELKNAYTLDTLPESVTDLKLLSPYEILSDYPYEECENPSDIISGKPYVSERKEPLLIMTHKNTVLAAYEKTDRGVYICKRGLL